MFLIDEIQSIIHSRGGTKGFADFVESVSTPDANGKTKMEPEEFSFKAMHEAFLREANGVKEAVDSTAFAKATGALINKKVIDGYDSQPSIGDLLCTIMPSSFKEETIVGFNALDTPEEVGEGMPYADSGTAEKYVTITNSKFGRIISITEETIMFDQTGQILVRAYQLGEKARLHREKKIVRAVTELDSNIYKPSGTSTTLYDSSTNSNVSSSSPFGTVGLQSAINTLREFTDENSDPIIVPEPWNLLVPSELTFAAERMYKSELDPTNAENGANIFSGKYNPLSSPFLTSSTDWWIGNFKRQFVWTQVYPLQVLSAPAGHEEDFNKDIRYKHKVRYYGGIGAVDTKYVVEANA